MGKEPEKKTYISQQVYEKRLNITNFKENAIKTIMSQHLIPTMKKPRDYKCQQGCEVKGTLYSAAKNVNWDSHYGKQYESSSRN